VCHIGVRKRDRDSVSRKNGKGNGPKTKRGLWKGLQGKEEEMENTKRPELERSI